MDKETRGSLNEIINYLHADERRHWEELDKPAHHIFHDIERVVDWLASTRDNNHE